LVNTITASSPVEVDEIVRRLRSRENIGAIITSARSGTLLQQLTGRDVEMQSGIDGDYSSREQTFGLTRVGVRTGHPDSDFPQSRAPDAHTPLTNQNHQWTTVTDDQEFVDHLISVYFTWQHAFFQSFPERLFRQDMAAGRTKYCSKFLVNAICAAGALLSTDPKVRRDQNDPKSADMAFFEEAVRLLHQDQQASSIPTVAGLFLLSHVEGYRGRLSRVWGYCGQSSRTALDLNLHLRSEKPDSDGARIEEVAKIHTFWGCFIADQ
jgi:Fungal specific transcription factor domain